MKLHDELVIYEQESVSDGAAGQMPSPLSEVCTQWGMVKPLSGQMAMNFQSTYGTQGFEVTIRTDFEFDPLRTYIIGYKGIYGEKMMTIVYPLIEKNYTKFICKSENKLSVSTS